MGDKTSDPRPRPLSEIKVDTLRTTFFWPLTLDRLPGEKGVLDSVEFLKLQEKWLSADGSPWKVVEDGLKHLPEKWEEKTPPKAGCADPTASSSSEMDLAAKTDRNVAMADAYGEFTYFHDFVQRMLFGKTGGKDAGPLRLFQRKDIEGLEFRLYDDSTPLVFTVERLNIYILAYGVAVVVLQASNSAGSTLKDILDFNDRMRRSHAPFFEVDKDSGRISARQLPHTVTWKSTTAENTAFPGLGDGIESKPKVDPEGNTLFDRYLAAPYAKLYTTGLDAERRVLPASHWRWLLNGPEGTTERIPLQHARQGYRWRHFSDDRFPILTTVVLKDQEDYYNLSEGHWMRLAFVDQSGSDPYPYAPEFLRPDFPRHCYDRFHHKKGATDDAPTRYLMCDYAMTAVTHRQSSLPDKTDGSKAIIKENTYAKTIEMHMQRHYYQMFLLQVIDKAVMLGLSSRITRAVERFGEPQHESALSASLQDIERDFLQYVHRFRFTGISGQLQATELHNKLRSLMGLEAMFQDIKAELETAIGFLSARESEHATEAAERLNIVASLGVVIALVFGFLSMNILTDKDTIVELVGYIPWAIHDEPPPLLQHLFAFLVVLIIISATAFGLSKAIEWKVGRRGKGQRSAERFVRHALCMIFFLAFILLLTLPEFTP